MSPESFIGRKAIDLPSPSLILSRPILEKNASKMLADTAAKGFAFRPHVKTLKSAEATRLMLGGKHRKVAVSTIAEIRGLLPLVKDGSVDEILFAMPLPLSKLPELRQLSQQAHIVVLLDHEAHLDALDGEDQVWDIFVKVDVGSHRAGLPLGSARLQKFLSRAVASKTVRVVGLYTHAGESYDCLTPDSARDVLQREVESVVKTAELLPEDQKFTVSFGSTPAAHVVEALSALPTRPKLTLELHAGNYIANDLMQVATGSINLEDQAARVVAEVCSVYPERNEALINAGVLALSKETSEFPGYGTVIGHKGWYVRDISQEHGILSWRGESGEEQHVEKTFKVGDKVLMYISHSCITAAAYPHYFVVDGKDEVTEIWYPWKWW